MSILHPTSDTFPRKLLLILASASIFTIDLQIGLGSSCTGLPEMTPQKLFETSNISLEQ